MQTIVYRDIVRLLNALQSWIKSQLTIYSFYPLRDIQHIFTNMSCVVLKYGKWVHVPDVVPYTKCVFFPTLASNLFPSLVFTTIMFIYCNSLFCLSWGHDIWSIQERFKHQMRHSNSNMSTTDMVMSNRNRNRRTDCDCIFGAKVESIAIAVTV